MHAERSKSEILYGGVKTALLSGRYAPGDRIDPAALAEEFKTSPTPVLYALHRLLGEDLIEHHGRDGLHLPILLEFDLRDMYGWMQHLLLTACDATLENGDEFLGEIDLESSISDIVAGTKALFESISYASGRCSLHRAVVHLNEKLSPLRRLKRRLLFNNAEELDDLQQKWLARDLSALKISLVTYHERRLRAVPSIVALQTGAFNARMSESMTFADGDPPATPESRH
ncbi:GntR family transcriptional regulator [Luteimonas sp. BDR2-5]|uniref:GntR family transcriptional regulator n=1 Tax=Proluteimonas luteida TaxID=2878685 RepID=UPI001E30D37F|nr:GntR family transcriptional regulator [Luteimonas sp. BDR2-5]MCD9026781.1 GntR family transcriptional regulator [Luteimonas sp. BDR2-5]